MITQELAKTQSHDRLRNLGLKANERLPFIESPEKLHPQDARSVAIRTIILSHVIGIAFGAQASQLRKLLLDFGLFEHCSNEERRLFSKESHSPQEKTNCLWLVECVQSLAWCLGLVELDPLRNCDDDLASHFPRPSTNPLGFISQATLRPLDEIYQEADFHYRLHWIARQAELTRTQCPVQQSLVWERRRALDWVLGVGSDWDEMPQDT